MNPTPKHPSSASASERATATKNRQMQDSVEQIARDVRDHAKSLTAIIEDQRAMKEEIAVLREDKAVRVVKDDNLNDRLDRIDDRINGIFSLGKWLLAAVGTVLIAVVIDFVVHGGLTHVG